ncbi:caspase family protein [Nocardia tengchongensis]|uniref:caspase, EACC1-associated type n=1 Tax=Nocardia tengchongensis TaxID=2055889 RepID=UPI0036C1B063
MALPDPEASRAILIGTAHYASDSGFESFPEIERSLGDFAEFLHRETGLPKQHIDVVLDPENNQTIAGRVTAAAQAATGLLLVYYVGHGVAVDNQLHLTHTGSRSNEADVTALAYPVLRSRIKTNARGPVVVILDCCHSGRAFGRDVLAGDGEQLQEATDIDGAFVLTATDEKTKFARARGDSGRTAFTGMMLDILRDGIATADRHLTMTVLFRELRSRLPAANLPKPKALERGTAGRVALAANAGWTGRIETAALPRTGDTPYTATIRDLTPADGLLDRETELAELAAFCDGDEPYIWWQAGPWAGKTALMTWFALNPPPHTRVVSFFITSRMAAQDDHNAFTDALLEQLSALLPDQAAAVASPTANRDALRRHLLDLAAQRAADSGGRLVLLVDGLDEDRGQPSIASLLPKRPGPGLRVIVAGRPNPVLPLDVPTNHPLHHCRRREVDRSRAAFDIIQAARLELRGIIDRSDIDQEVLGLITAAHGLTGTELEDLTGLPPFRINTILSGVTGRTFRARSSRFAPDQINLLAHETLQQEAEIALGRSLMDEYRNRIHDWAARYRELGWPDETPTYLLTRYFSMLRGQDDLDRLTNLALDTARHDRMLLLTGGDGMARAEIGTVSAIWMSRCEPDLFALCELAMRRRRLTLRGTNIPVELPAVYAMLGDLTRANGLAGGISLPWSRLQARIELAAAQFTANDPARNRSLIESTHGVSSRLPDDRDRYRLGAALVAAGDLDGAVQLAREITSPRERVRILAQLVSAWRSSDRRSAIGEAMSEIERHVRSAEGSEHRDEVLRYAADALADIGDFEHAHALVARLGSAKLRIAAWCRISRSLTAHGQVEPAKHLARAALSAAEEKFAGDRTIEVLTRSWLLAQIAADLVAVGLRDELRTGVADLESGLAGYLPPVRPAVVEQLVVCLIELGEVDYALSLGRRFTTDANGVGVLLRTLPAFVAADRTAEARQLAIEIELISYGRPADPHEHGFALHTLVRALSTVGQRSSAHAMADRIEEQGCRFLAFTYLGTRAPESPEHARVFLERATTALHDLLRRVSKGDDHAYLALTRTVLATDWLGHHRAAVSPAPLEELVRGLVAAGAIDRAIWVVHRLALLTSNWFDPPRGADRVLGGVAGVFAAAGHTDAAHSVIRDIGIPSYRLTVLLAMAEQIGTGHAARIAGPMLDEFKVDVMAGAFSPTPSDRANLVRLAAAMGDARWVRRLIDRGTDTGPGAEQLLSALVTASARSADIDGAAAVAGTISDDVEMSRAYREIVAAQVRAGHPRSALDSAARIPVVGTRVRAMAMVIPAMAKHLGEEPAATALRDATRLLPEIERTDGRNRATAALVDAALAIGDIDHAIESARATEADSRAELLTRVVDALVEQDAAAPTGEREVQAQRIRGLLAEIWSSGRWYAALDAVARFDPELLSAIAVEALRWVVEEDPMTNRTSAVQNSARGASSTRGITRAVRFW